MSLLLPSESFIRQIEKSEIAYMKNKMEAIRIRKGNPEGVRIGCFGNSLCLYSKTMPWPAFNTVKGITTNDMDQLDQIFDFYQSRGRKIQIEIVPSRVDQQFLLELSNRGLYQSGFHTVMYGTPCKPPKDVREDVEIKEMEENDFTAYATVHCRGTGLPDNGIPHVAENNKILWKQSGWRFFMAYILDQPAAVGVMFTKDRVSSFTFAATLPEFRKRGLHRSLLRTRISESFRQKSNLIVSQCALLSQSHRNMERESMKIGYVKTIWTEK